MAEARREIVTALKFHRAAMKQANEQQQHQQPFQTLEPQPQIQVPHQPSLEHATEKMNTNYSNYIPFSSSLAFPPHRSHFSWASSNSHIASSPIPESYNFSPPNQTLGLNLNLHDFNYNNSNNPSIYSSSSSSSSSSTSSSSYSPPPSAVISAENPPMMEDGLMHPAMDDEEMAEIRSIGEKHQMEWNDRLDLMTSAWWFKFLNTMEISPDTESKQNDGFHPFDEVMEFPSWLNANANESCFWQQNLEYLQDPVLPCMESGEIDGMDGEWLD